MFARSLPLFLALLTVLFLSSAEARVPRQKRIYNPKTVETVTGKVLRVETTRRKGKPVQLVLATSAGKLPVHLGPHWYLERQSLKIHPQDTVSVTGSRVRVRGKTVLIAAEIKRGNETLLLRQGDGTPLWGRNVRKSYQEEDFGPWDTTQEAGRESLLQVTLRSHPAPGSASR